MPYKKQNFQDGQVLKAEHLNTIEDGLVELEKALAETDKKASELDTKSKETENTVKELQKEIGELKEQFENDTGTDTNYAEKFSEIEDKIKAIDNEITEIKNSLSNTVSLNQGEENAGKALVVDSTGKVGPGTVTGSGDTISSITNAEIDDIVEGEPEEPEVEEASADGEVDS